ncbi:MAG: rod shape-determining protein MreD [Neisseria sp.]|nr:rod shape-determining protein MreD [Neisseria sp.]
MNDWGRSGFQSSRRLLVASFVFALLLAALPLSKQYFFWLPDWVGMVLLFWVIQRPSDINLGAAFGVGLLLDILINAPLGAHALAYLCSTFVVWQRRRQIAAYGFGMQAAVVAAALLLGQIVLALIWAYLARSFVGWHIVWPPLGAALLWPLLNKLMLHLSSLRWRRS